MSERRRIRLTTDAGTVLHDEWVDEDRLGPAVEALGQRYETIVQEVTAAGGTVTCTITGCGYLTTWEMTGR